MSDLNEMLDEVLKDVDEVRMLINDLRRENSRLTFENGALRERLRLSEEVNYSDDLADARRDRERDLEFERSADYQARGERG